MIFNLASGLEIIYVKEIIKYTIVDTKPSTTQSSSLLTSLEAEWNVFEPLLMVIFLSKFSTLNDFLSVFIFHPNPGNLLLSKTNGNFKDRLPLSSSFILYSFCVTNNYN